MTTNGSNTNADNIITLPRVDPIEAPIIGGWVGIAQAIDSDPVCKALSMIGQRSSKATNGGIIDYLDAAFLVAHEHPQVGSGVAWTEFVAKVKNGGELPPTEVELLS